MSDDEVERDLILYRLSDEEKHAQEKINTLLIDALNEIEKMNMMKISSKVMYSVTTVFVMDVLVNISKGKQVEFGLCLKAFHRTLDLMYEHYKDKLDSGGGMKGSA